MLLGRRERQIAAVRDCDAALVLNPVRTLHRVLHRVLHAPSGMLDVLDVSDVMSDVMSDCEWCLSNTHNLVCNRSQGHAIALSCQIVVQSDCDPIWHATALELESGNLAYSYTRDHP